MASWESKSWPVRRWLADRLVGDHAYSKNTINPWSQPHDGRWQRAAYLENLQRGVRMTETEQTARIRGWSTQPPLRPVDRNPQETA